MDDRRRWTILAVGTGAQPATCSFIYGIPMLVPELRGAGTSLFAASLVVSAPIVGVLLTLIAWGALADRFGERIVIMSGGRCLDRGARGSGMCPGRCGARRDARAGRSVRGLGERRERPGRDGLVPDVGARPAQAVTDVADAMTSDVRAIGGG